MRHFLVEAVEILQLQSLASVSERDISNEGDSGQIGANFLVWFLGGRAAYPVLGCEELLCGKWGVVTVDTLLIMFGRESSNFPTARYTLAYVVA